jgi:hypothetical protein
MLAMMVVAAISGLVTVPLLSMFVYVNPLRILAALALLAGASVALDWLTRVRVERRAEGMEFAA